MKVEITWIDVKEELPPNDMWVLVTYQDTAVTEAYFNKRKKEFVGRDDWKLNSVNAWARMPEHYKITE